MCRTSGRTPAFSAWATASPNAASWAATEGWPGMSAQAKWDHRPTTRTRPRSSAASAASMSPGQSAGVAPPRFSPVSASRCSRAGRPARSAAAAILAAKAAEPAVTSMPASMAAAGSPIAISASTGAVMPARRSSSPSAASTTPSQVAPPASAARAAGTIP